MRSDLPNSVWDTTNQVEDLNLISEEQISTGNVSLTKTDASGVTPEGDASIAGVRFAVINRSTNAVIYKGTTYNPGVVMQILLLTTSGTAATDANSMPYGTYEIVELRADATITAGETYNGSAKLGSSNLATLVSSYYYITDYCK